MSADVTFRVAGAVAYVYVAATGVARRVSGAVGQLPVHALGDSGATARARDKVSQVQRLRGSYSCYNNNNEL